MLFGLEGHQRIKAVEISGGRPNERLWLVRGEDAFFVRRPHEELTRPDALWAIERADLRRVETDLRALLGRGTFMTCPAARLRSIELEVREAVERREITVVRARAAHAVQQAPADTLIRGLDAALDGRPLFHGGQRHVLVFGEELKKLLREGSWRALRPQAAEGGPRTPG